MEWLKDLLVEHSALQAVVVISLISTIGIGLGKIRFFGISLGTAFIFFVGILAGHFGLSLDPAMLTYAEDFGLIIFVYALGLQVGPGFFSSMRADGLRLVSPAIAVVLAGTALAVALSYAFGIPMPDMSGILCGATTNTPALGAAQQTLQQAGLDANGAALSCAVTYPLGVVGVILAIVTLRKLFVRPADMPGPDAEHKKNLFIASYHLTNPAVFGKSIHDIAAESFLPLISGRVTRMRCDMSCPSTEFQSMFSVFQSFCSCSPKMSRRASASSRLVMTRMTSSRCNCLSDVGIETCPLRQRREMTKWWWLSAAMSWMLLPKTAGFVRW